MNGPEEGEQMPVSKVFISQHFCFLGSSETDHFCVEDAFEATTVLWFGCAVCSIFGWVAVCEV
jgi:hypothetical protein